MSNENSSSSHLKGSTNTQSAHTLTWHARHEGGNQNCASTMCQQHRSWPVPRCKAHPALLELCTQMLRRVRCVMHLCLEANAAALRHSCGAPCRSLMPTAATHNGSSVSSCLLGLQGTAVRRCRQRLGRVCGNASICTHGGTNGFASCAQHDFAADRMQQQMSAPRQGS